MVRFTVYETMRRVYIVGANATQTLFRLLKVERALADPSELVVQEDHGVYDAQGLGTLLQMVGEAAKPHGGLVQVAQGVALLGFVRFMFGYYLHIATQVSARWCGGPCGRA